MTQPVRLMNWCAISHGHEMQVSVTGPYVTYTDYLALEAERDQLRHECARLGAKVSALDGLLGTALAERDALRADARRYRWLRDKMGGDEIASMWFNSKPETTDAELDAAIDSVLATQEAG